MKFAGRDLAFVVVAACVALTACDDQNGAGAPATPAPEVGDELFVLGQALFFDKILSGNLDVACATCHHPSFGTGDDLSLSRGVDAEGLGADRSGGRVIARNAPALFNLHMYPAMFWDSRVAANADGGLQTPAGAQLTPAMEATLAFGVVAAQAMFPVASRDEMRGALGSNDLAAVADDDFTSIWRALMTRLGAIPAYVTLFETAYPGTKFGEMTFAHAANAIAAFEIRAFDRSDSPYQRFLLGDTNALTRAQERGMNNFRDACGNCHNGPLLSDFEHHNTALAQFGPGAGDGPASNDDFAREGVSGDQRDRYAFRTAPLLNVALTGPFGHAGQFGTLREFVSHYRDPEEQLRNYDVSAHVAEPGLSDTVVPNTTAVIASIDRQMRRVGRFDVDDIVAFLEATTADDARSLLDTVPAHVPSGLPVD